MVAYPEELAVVTSIVNAQVHIKIWDTFVITMIENGFADDEVIFQNDNASCQRKNINSLAWILRSRISIRLKNYDGISLKQMAHDKTPFYKADLSTAIRESQNQVNGKYSFSLMKPIPQEMVSCLLSIAALH